MRAFFTKKNEERPINFVDSSVVINGDLVFGKSLEIQGSVYGNILSDFKSISFLTIGKDSKISGDVLSGNIVVSGKVFGNLFAQHIKIDESAKIVGSIKYKSIEVHSGAKINGLITPFVQTKNTFFDDKKIKQKQNYTNVSNSSQLVTNILSNKLTSPIMEIRE